jgi:hypothetical protein
MPDVTVSADIDAFMVAVNDAAARGELALTSLAITTPGTGVATALGVNIGSAGAFVTFNGAGGTPSSMVGTNITGTAAGLTAGAASAIAVGSITGLGTGVGTFLATPSGANLATALTTALPATKGGTGLTALGTGIATALGVNANAGGGLIVLADPGADRIPFWDDSAGAFVFLTVGTGLDITNTTLTATGSGATAVTAASVAAGAGLLWISDGADRSAVATDTVDTINATNANATTLVLGGVTITATGTELNFTDGVTSAIQTQLNAKANLAGGNTFTGAQVFPSGQALIAPVLGTPTSGTLTNCTGLPASGIVAGTLAGTITLGEGAQQIALDPALSADGTYSGIVMTGTAGYTQAFGDVVYLDPTDSRWEACDANAAAGADGDCRGSVCMVVVAGTDGNPCTLLVRGKIRADANFPSFTINNPIYISETAGDVTQTQPTTTDVVIRIIGWALTADEMMFAPDNMWITHT